MSFGEVEYFFLSLVFLHLHEGTKNSDYQVFLFGSSDKIVLPVDQHHLLNQKKKTGDSNSTLASNVPLIYNMRTNEWVHQFDPVPKGSPPGSNHTVVAAIFFCFVVSCVILVGALIRREMTLPKQKSMEDGGGDVEEEAGGSQFGSESSWRTKASTTDLLASKWACARSFLARPSVAIPLKPETLSTETLSWASLLASTPTLPEQEQVPSYGSLGIPENSYDTGTTKDAGAAAF